jgi:hypothetical protein
MRKLQSAVLAGLIALTGACGSSSKSGGTGGTGGADGGGGTDGATDGAAAINVTVSGTASPHPLTLMLDPTADFSMLKVSVVDPQVEIAGGPALQSGNLDTSPGNCGMASDAGAGDGGATDAAADAAAGAGSGCAWSLSPVNIAGIQLGLVGKLEDLRTTNPIWVKTGTGAGTAAFINMEKVSKAPITGRQLFAVSVGTQTALATFVSTVLTQTDAGAALTGTEMQARGYLIGHIVGKLSEGAPPVAGATVALPSGSAAAGQMDIIYPNATFTGAGTSTAPHGIFLAVPKASGTPTAIVAGWTVTPPTGSTLTWQTYLAGTQPGAAFVLLFLADEGGG